LKISIIIGVSIDLLFSAKEIKEGENKNGLRRIFEG